MKNVGAILIARTSKKGKIKMNIEKSKIREDYYE